MMKNYKDTYQNTLIASGKKDLSMKELQALTCLSILSVQGVIYTHYKNKQREGTWQEKQKRKKKSIPMF